MEAHLELISPPILHPNPRFRGNKGPMRRARDDPVTTPARKMIIRVGEPRLAPRAFLICPLHKVALLLPRLILDQVGATTLRNFVAALRDATFIAVFLFEF